MRTQSGRPMGRAAPLAGAFSLLLLFAAPASLGAPTAEPRTTFEEVGTSLMSPVCPGKLLQDCPSGEGAQLRELVRRKIAAGETKEQIVGYFVDVYGIGVLPNPPPEGFYLTAWLLPFAGLASGLGVFFVLVRAWSRRAKRSGAESPSPGEGGEAPGGAEETLEGRLRRELSEFGE